MGSARSALSRTCLAALTCAALVAAAEAPGRAQGGDFVPVTDAMLQEPNPADWLMWRRTLDGWGYSPLDSITRENVGDLRMVWSRALQAGTQEGTPLAYDGVLYMPNPFDVIQAIDAVTGDLRWEYRRDLPDDLDDYLFAVATNRNIAIHGNLIIDNSADDHVYALDATTGELAWETQILDYRTQPANQTSGPIVANGRVVSGRSCMPAGGPHACVITAHDAATGAELWRRRLIPGPGEPGDETWGGVPFEQRAHVGAWMVPSYDAELDLVYVGTSVTSPAPKFLLGGTGNTHLYHNSTLALDGATGEIRWHYQHLNDHWDLDHPFERLLVDTAVSPDPAAVSWINPPAAPGRAAEGRHRHPGQDRRGLHAGPGDRRVPVGDADHHPERHQRHRRRHRRGAGETRRSSSRASARRFLACPTWLGGKDWEAGAYSPLTNTMYFPLRNACAPDDGDATAGRTTSARACTRWPCATSSRPGSTQLGTVRAISRGDRRDRVAARPARDDHVARRHGRRPRLRRRRQRPLPRLRPRDGRGPLGDQPRVARHRVPDHVCRRRPAVTSR